MKFYDITGKPRWRSSGSRDRAVAEALLRDQLGQRDRGAPVLPDPRRLSVDTLLENLIDEYKINNRRSLDRADLSCRQLRRFFSGRPATSVTGADVGKYANLRLGEGAAPATVNRELSALRRAYRLDGLLAAAIPIRALVENNTRVGFLDHDQVETVCRRLGPVEADAVRFMFITGWRSRSEVFPLTWAQVDLPGGFVRLEPGRTKNREGRVFPITPELAAVLQHRLEDTCRCERAQGRVIAAVFHRSARPSRRCGSRGPPRVGEPGFRGSSCTTSGASPSGTSSRPASHARSP